MAARQTEPAPLHIQEVLPELGVGLEAGPICALRGVQTALSHFPTYAYKHRDLPGRPDTPMACNVALTLDRVNHRTSEKKECDVSFVRNSICSLSGARPLE